MSLPMVARPPARRHAGVCRVCGCTENEACHGGCSWVDSTLCSRCHGPKHPTRAQVGELGRIRERLGPVRVNAGQLAGELEVVLYGTAEERLWRLEHNKKARALVLNTRGHVIRRYGVWA